MHITLGAEVALSLHMENQLTYANIEGALVDAGFTNYTILRTINYDGSSDAQVYVREGTDANGQQLSLPAVDTMEKLTAAITAIEAVEDEDAGGGGSA